MQVKIVGIPWYRQEDYDQLRAMFSDGSKLHATFDGWLASAQALHDRLVNEGHAVEKAWIDPNTFSAWCSAHGKPLDATGRTAFANERAANKVLNG